MGKLVQVEYGESPSDERWLRVRAALTKQRQPGDGRRPMNGTEEVVPPRRRHGRSAGGPGALCKRKTEKKIGSKSGRAARCRPCGHAPPVLTMPATVVMAEGSTRGTFGDDGALAPWRAAPEVRRHTTLLRTGKSC